MVDNNEMQLEYNMFADIWKLLKTNYIPSGNEVYWNNLITAAHEIEVKYNSKLCNDLLVSIIMELERKHIKSNENSS